VQGAEPTLFDFPEHLRQPVFHRKPPAVRAAIERPSTSSVVDISASTEAPEQQTATTSRASKRDHSYCVQSLTKLKRKLTGAISALETARKKLKLAQQCNRRLCDRVTSVQCLLSELKSKQLLSEQAAGMLSSSFGESALALVSRCLNKTSQSPGVVYPAELRSFALSLHFYSAKAYDFVRNQFSNCLPHPKTLSRWYSCITGDPGFHTDTFAALKCMADSRDQPVICSMMMDEVAIRKELDWDGNKFIGYVDLGVEIEDSSSLPVAKEALVFMIVSITERWKVSVAYFLTDGLQGKERANLVLICLRKLHAAGIRVVSLTFDGSSANCSMADNLGAKLHADNPVTSFPHPEIPCNDVQIFLDACHMVKLMRNMLADKKVLLDEKNQEIKWAYIERLENLQRQEGLRASTKLHERRIQWHQQKMKVKLAVQTLSSSVADALVFCDQVQKLPQFQGCGPTVTFIRTIDRLFDLLNSRNPVARGYKAPMRITNQACWRLFIRESTQYLRGLQLENGQFISASLRKTAVVGFVISSASAVARFDKLVVQENILKYILTYKMSQDHLELFFSAVRSRGGWNNNPSAVHFKAAWKRLLTHQQLHEVKTGNVEPQTYCPVLSLSSRISRNETVDVTTAAKLRMESTLWDLCLPSANIADVSASIPDMSERCLSLFVDNVVVYIAGFVIRSLQKRILCPDCQAALFSTVKMVEDHDHGLLQTKNHGGLLHTSNDVVKLCKMTESHFRSLMAPGQKPVLYSDLKTETCNSVLRAFVGVELFPDLLEHTFDSDPVDDHRVILMKKIVFEYLTCRLHHQAKCFTRTMHLQSKRSKLTKTVLFCGQ